MEPTLSEGEGVLFLEGVFAGGDRCARRRRIASTEKTGGGAGAGNGVGSRGAGVALSDKSGANMESRGRTGQEGT